MPMWSSSLLREKSVSVTFWDSISIDCAMSVMSIPVYDAIMLRWFTTLLDDLLTSSKDSWPSFRTTRSRSTVMLSLASRTDWILSAMWSSGCWRNSTLFFWNILHLLRIEHVSGNPRWEGSGRSSSLVVTSAKSFFRWFFRISLFSGSVRGNFEEMSTNVDSLNHVCPNFGKILMASYSCIEFVVNMNLILGCFLFLVLSLWSLPPNTRQAGSSSMSECFECLGGISFSRQFSNLIKWNVKPIDVEFLEPNTSSKTSSNGCVESSSALLWSVFKSWISFTL